MSRVLLDANVLVYAQDKREVEKQRTAVDVLSRLVPSGLVVVSTQVLGEFYAISTRKIPRPLSDEEAAVVVAGLIEAADVLAVTSLVIEEAMKAVRVHRLHYWDAQLWATARLNSIEVILTEDFEDGRVLEGVRFVDPFADGFSLAQLGLPGE